MPRGSSDGSSYSPSNRGLLGQRDRSTSFASFASSSRLEHNKDALVGMPTLEDLYADNRNSFRDSRYNSFASLPRISPPGSAPNMSPASSQADLARPHPAAPPAPSPYGLYEKGEWIAEDDDVLHGDAGGTAGKRVGASRLIYESSAFRGRSFWSSRGLLNMGAVVLLLLTVVGVFCGYPVASALTSNAAAVNTTSYLSGTPNSASSSGDPIVSNAPSITNRGLIDPDTPTSVYTKTGVDDVELTLVFSDEFNTDGRTFYPNEDPFFTAVDLDYWQTDDIEWYDPDNLITKDGYLAITLSKESNASSHGKGYLGGLVTSWNQLCITGGRVEVALSLPGDNQVSGLWPATWLMGNLGRAGYGASLEGTWPYSYESCDVGTAPNQTHNDLPDIALTSGASSYDGTLSYLPGQKLSACTCPGSNHPGPQYSNGSYAGRGAPEIDIFEATASSDGGHVSQSGQWAPFNPYYYIVNTTTNDVEYYDDNDFETTVNSYLGGVYQQSTSALSATNASTYNSTTDFAMYGIEYTPTYLNGAGTGKITWLQEQEEMWMLSDRAMAANKEAEISQRPVTGEPLYVIFNLGMSTSFTTVDLDELLFPATMRIDHIRIYQPTDQINIGCSTELFPTADYIANNKEAYTNSNLTTWADYNNSTFPLNSYVDGCS